MNFIRESLQNFIIFQYIKTLLNYVIYFRFMVIKISSACIGCGNCASICPEVFEMKGAKAVVKAQKKLPCVKEAIESCPVDAISQ